MSKRCENRYKLCREAAGYTQYQAAELLNVSDRSLSDYENGHSLPPDNIVAKMADEYNSPLLAWWHIKENTVLGKYLPEIQMPQSLGDMTLQFVLAKDDSERVADMMKVIMSNGRIDAHEWDDFTEHINVARCIAGRLFSAIVFAEKVCREVGRDGRDKNS